MKSHDIRMLPRCGAEVGGHRKLLSIATTYLEKVLRMEEADKLLKKAYDLMSEGEYQKAMSNFDKVAKMDPNNAEAYFGKAEAAVLVPKVKIEDVLASYKKAVELDSKNPLYHSAMGAFAVDAGLFNEAEQAYKKAAELDPENAPYYYSEFGVEYFRRAPVVMEAYMDDKTEEMVIKKSLKYLLLAIGLDEAGAKELLSRS
jgi:tetratricopeptide (TPR) repeat protein